MSVVYACVAVCRNTTHTPRRLKANAKMDPSTIHVYTEHGSHTRGTRATRHTAPYALRFSVGTVTVGPYRVARSRTHHVGCSVGEARIVADQPFRACGPRLMDFGTVQAGFHSVWPRIFTASRRRQTASTPSGHGVMSVHGTTIEHSPHDRAGAAAAKSITAGGDGRST